MSTASALAEQADRYKKTIIEAESGVTDNKKKINALTGDVTVTRGTLTIKTEKAVTTEAADGTMFVVLTGGPGGQVFFRQKRDGGPDLWVEGVANRMEYDEKTELVKFFTKAHVKYLENKKVTQEQEGEFLSYDSRNEVFVGTNNASGSTVAGGGRIKLTIQPKLEQPKSEEQKK
ncbi:lipopolysaccharide transport periplasmic protein LptA [Undibacterium sp.]|uniref:lipopolysaccharide transport periplasmic protein LptA n=1 Tax=Undibacterium sp. TaxID=1914977 RepID=UPI002D18F2CB|nr:lipopolysaccharide transport periplasmic protein LptA [Undibacterium sp.]HTD04710.1 lipopolysaccharide transport periplasmic protein LptA [Undibacterium sp.]